MKVVVFEICRISLTWYEKCSFYIRKRVDNLKVSISGDYLLASLRAFHKIMINK